MKPAGWPRLSRRAAIGVVLGLALVVVVAGIGAYLVLPQRELDTPCPTVGRAEHPLATHLVPNVLEHQSWLLVPTTGLQSGTVLLACTDGVVIGIDPLDQSDVDTGTDTLPIPTRWVDGKWFAGQLGAYLTPDRWVVIYPSTS